MSVAQLAVPLHAPKPRLTILHVTAPASVGGLERVVESLAVGHAQRGHCVHVAAVLTTHGEEPAFLTALRQRCVFVHTLRIGARAYRAERAFMDCLLRSVRPDVVHTHGYRSDVVDGAAARRAGVPSVTTVHGFTRGRARARLYEWLQRRSHRHFDAVVAVSRAQTSELAAAGVAREKLFHVQNAWAGAGDRIPAALARSALGIDPGRFHVGWVGRLSHEKGPDILIKAMPHWLDSEAEPITVSVIGDGPARMQLRRLAERLGVASYIRWHGSLRDAGRYFEAFDAFVLSSRTEGTPIVLFEAMAAGTPIVATAVGGVPDVVGPDEALLAPSEDPVALADAIQYVRIDPEATRQRTLAASARLCAHFDADRWLTAYEAVYAQAAQSTRKM